MWSFENPVKIRFGVGAFDSVGKLINRRPYCLVTYGDPYFDELGAKLAGAAGQAAAVINNITPNPDFVTLADSCARFEQAVDKDTVIIALGGGSVIDAAKVLASGGHGLAAVRRFLETGEDEDRLTSYPIIAVPTTAGTGSEVTCWATVWDMGAQKKYSLARHTLYPEHAVIDPSLALGIPKDLTISTALDALSHALESIWNRNSNPISANYAIFAAREIIATLPSLVDDLGNIDIRTRVARACLFAGLAFSNTKTALAHSISYPITIKHNILHGLACSFSLPMVLASVIGEDAECDQNLRRVFGDDLDSAVVALEKFLNGLGVPTKASSYGIQNEQLNELLTTALAGERGRNFIGRLERVLEKFTV